MVCSLSTQPRQQRCIRGLPIELVLPVCIGGGGPLLLLLVEVTGVGVNSITVRTRREVMSTPAKKVCS